MSTATLKCSTNDMKTMPHTPGAALAAGDVVVINTRVCFAYDDIGASEEGYVVHAAEDVEVAKAGVAVTAGETAYYHPGNDNFTNVVTGATKCGMFIKDNAIGDATARIELDNSVNL